MRILNSNLKWVSYILLVGFCDNAFSEQSVFTLSTGAEYTSGDYSGNTSIEELYVPITGSFTKGSINYRLTVPYISVRAPVGTIVTDTQGQAVVTEGPKTTEKGLGDIIGRVTFYDVFVSPSRNFFIDASAKVKFGTADEDKGLGTGKNDYSLQTTLYHYFDDFYLLGTIGYKFRGDPEGFDLNNAWYGTVGVNYSFTHQLRTGLSYDYRQSSIKGGEASQELSGFISRKLNDSWRLQLYVLAGLSNSSPDWGGGMLLKYYL